MNLLSKKHLAFLAAVLTAKKVISIPSGVALEINILFLFFAAMLVDFVQIPIFDYVYSKGFEKMRLEDNHNAADNTCSPRPLSGLTAAGARLAGKIKASSIGRLALKMKFWGVFLVSAWPLMGGGVWTAVLLGKMCGIARAKIYFFTLLGSFASGVILYLGSRGVLKCLAPYLHLP